MVFFADSSRAGSAAFSERSGWFLVGGLSGALPTLLAFNLPPSATLLNQAAALVVWGASTVIAISLVPSAALARSVGWIAFLSLLALSSATLLAPLWTDSPWGLALSSGAVVLSAAALVALGTAFREAGRVSEMFDVFCWAWVIAGVLSIAIGIVQVFAPSFADGDLIAPTTTPGRAVGNLRQPNHLSSLLLWSMISALWLAESRTHARRWADALLVLFLFGVVLTASRTGVVGVLLLAGWGLLDKRLSPRSRWLLMTSPFSYATIWAALSVWARSEHQVFIGEARLTADGDLSSDRFAIWSNTLDLIARHPWFGVGFGEFNFAWTLTPFPDRPRQFFDHAHNLPLHLIAELGIPLGMLVLALLAYALWRAFVASREATGLEGTTLRCAFMMVLMMALHSQLEYPLWYAYFLLPTALVFGLCLGGPARPAPVEEPPSRPRTRPLLIASMLVMLGGFVAIYDYMKVVAIFAPREGAPPLAERIANGQRSWFFAHHADYAAATTAARPSEVIEAFDRATHYLLDARLMIAWSRALAESGDLERARHVAARLREFHHPLGEEFFAVCATDPKPLPLPFQCVAPTKTVDHRDFR